MTTTSPPATRPVSRKPEIAGALGTGSPPFGELPLGRSVPVARLIFGASLFALLIALIPNVSAQTPIAGAIVLGLTIANVLGLVRTRATLELLRGPWPVLPVYCVVVALGIALSDPGSPLIHAGIATTGIVGLAYRWRGVALVVPAFIAAHIISAASMPVRREALEEWYLGAGLPAQTWVYPWLGLVLLAGLGVTIRRMIEGVGDAIAAERQRLARDLHDSVGKTMTGTSLMAESLAGWAHRDPARAEEIARDIGRSLRLADDEARRIVHGLRFDGARGDLATALTRNVGRFSGRTGIAGSVRADGVPPLAQPFEDDMFAIVVEALTNIERHADASEVIVEVSDDGDDIVVQVSDNGQGCDLSSRGAAERHHLGLVGMQERAMRHGGQVAFSTPPDEGFVVEVRTPLHEAIASHGKAYPGLGRES